MKKVVEFIRACPAALAPLKADVSALGTLPTVAFQYCEAVRAASSYGWYVFPPADIVLRWDGNDVLYALENEWVDLKAIHLDQGSVDYWDRHAPDDLIGYSPPFMSHLLIPGVVQIWSGFFVQTAPGWSLIIRDPANIPQSKSFRCFDGIIETDSFAPCPLFMNIQITATDREIFIPRDKPLFQVMPVLRECYQDVALKDHPIIELSVADNDGYEITDAQWDGVRKTLRRIDADEAVSRSGAYGAKVRRRAKRDA
ncbi:MAG: DUF6065 family protein [Parvibaculum sp.]|uniref:DUF6065 family protein n=1 Tax=Alphaproteobacteria TaxID=28211 RepID=UPI00329962FB